MVERAEPEEDTAQRALQDALASIPDDTRRSAAPQAPSPERKPREESGPRLAALTADDRKVFTGDEDPLIKHITFLGSFMTRRLDEVDRRLEALAESLELLRASLRGTDSHRPVPASSSLADSLKLLRTSLRDADGADAPEPTAPVPAPSAPAVAGRRAKGTRSAARADPGKGSPS